MTFYEPLNGGNRKFLYAPYCIQDDGIGLIYGYPMGESKFGLFLCPDRFRPGVNCPRNLVDQWGNLTDNVSNSVCNPM